MACFYLICPSFVHASDNTQLAGYSRSTREEALSSDDIVIGRFTNTGHSGVAFFSGLLYEDAKLSISINLKGKLSGNVTVDYSIESSAATPNVVEVVPNVTDTYILIIYHGHQIRKMLPATDDNITEVKKIIATAPASK